MIEGHMFGNTIWAGHWLWMLLVAIAIVIPFWRICQRAGYPGWMGLLILVPMVNFLFLYFIAFARWPVAQAQDRND
ncbi:MAG: hypothetical protein LPJ91_09110 [Pseudazoarcus pumilus]|nr:hypothetical protein [Pseudazoarcus pumilus]